MTTAQVMPVQLGVESRSVRWASRRRGWPTNYREFRPRNRLAEVMAPAAIVVPLERGGIDKPRLRRSMKGERGRGLTARTDFRCRGRSQTLNQPIGSELVYHEAQREKTHQVAPLPMTKYGMKKQIADW